VEMCKLCKIIDIATFEELQKLSCRCGRHCNSCGKALREQPTGKVERCEACKEGRQMTRMMVGGMRENRRATR
jgi:hypothetical protein